MNFVLVYITSTVFHLCICSLYVSFVCLLNAAARLVLKVDRMNHDLRPMVRDSLHWLRIRERIEYKLCLLVYKALHGLAPQYIKDMCIPVNTVEHRSHLRSADKGDLLDPRHTLSTYGPRAFSIAGPQAWNALPANIRDPELTYERFCSCLKSHLFSLSYM